MDGCETRPALTVSFRLERGGQFESGFQKAQEQHGKYYWLWADLGFWGFWSTGK